MMKNHQLKSIAEECEQIDEGLKRHLEQYVVEKVAEEEIEETIEVLREYMPSRNKQKGSIALQILKNEMTYINPWYYIVAISFAMVGISMMKYQRLSPYNVMLIIAPVTLILGIVEMLRRSNPEILELEMSYKYSYRELVLCRLFWVGIVSIGFNMSVSIILGSFIDRSVMISFLGTWLIPYTLVVGLVFLMMSHTMNTKLFMAILFIWQCLSIVRGEKIVSWVMNKSDEMLIFTELGALILAGAAFRYFYKKRGWMMEII